MVLNHGIGKNREESLRTLMPKFLGIINEEGAKRPDSDFGGVSAVIRGDVEVILNGLPIGADRIVISAYSPVRSRLTKVFSAHLINASHRADPDSNRNLDCWIGSISWRRGDWEQIIVAHPAKSVSPSEAFLCGIFNEEGRIMN